MRLLTAVSSVRVCQGQPSKENINRLVGVFLLYPNIYFRTFFVCVASATHLNLQFNPLAGDGKPLANNVCIPLNKGQKLVTPTIEQNKKVCLKKASLFVFVYGKMP